MAGGSAVEVARRLEQEWRQAAQAWDQASAGWRDQAQATFATRYWTQIEADTGTYLHELRALADLLDQARRSVN